MLTITAPRPVAGRRSFIGVEFVDGVASVDSLHPERALALRQHGYAIEDAADPATLALPALRALAKDRGLKLPKRADRDQILWMLSQAPEPAEI